MIKIGGAGVVTPPPPYDQLLPLPISYFKMFLERFLNDLPPPPPHFNSSIFHWLLPPPLPPPLPPNKNFDNTPSAFRINEILTTLKQYFEGLRAIVNETNNDYQELNPLQYLGSVALWPPYRFSYAASKRFAVGRSNFQTFSITY